MGFDFTPADEQTHAARLVEYMRQGAQTGEHAGNIATDWSNEAQGRGMSPDATARIRRLAFNALEAQD